jgi:hypothetical protein
MSEFAEWFQGLMMRYAGLNPLRHILWEQHTISAKEIRIRAFGSQAMAPTAAGAASEQGFALAVRNTIVGRHKCYLANAGTVKGVVCSSDLIIADLAAFVFFFLGG